MRFSDLGMFGLVELALKLFLVLIVVSWFAIGTRQVVNITLSSIIFCDHLDLITEFDVLKT